MKRVVVLVAAALGLAACDDPNNHLLEGQQYDPEGACLGPAEVIDDLPGADPGDNCSPTCIIASGEDVTAVFITTTCPPFPGYASETPDAATGTDDPCTAAFAIFANTDAGACTGEGGTDAASDAGDGGVSDGASEAADSASDASSATESGADATMPLEASVDASDAGTSTTDAGADATAEAAPGVDAGADAPSDATAD